MEYRLSNTSSFGRAGSAPRSSISRCSTSLWRKIAFSAPDRRTPSIIELWFIASERIRQSGSILAIVAIPLSLDT